MLYTSLGCTQQLEESCVTLWRCVCRIQYIVSSNVILCIYHDSRRLCHSLFWKYIKAVCTLTANAVILPSLKCARSFFLIPWLYALVNANIAFVAEKRFESMYCQRQMRSQLAATRLGSASRTRWRWRKARCMMTSSNWRSKVWRASRCDDASSTSPTMTSPSKSSTKVRSPLLTSLMTSHVTSL